MKQFLLKIKEKYSNLKENSFINFVIGFVKTIGTILILLIIAIILIQRLSKNNVSLAGYRLYTIISDSMQPEYEIGDMLFAKEVTIEELEEGDNLVYNGEKDDFKGKTVVHKIMKIKKVNGKYEIITKGIANPVEDPTIYEHQIVAKVLYKTIVLSFISKILNNIYGFYFIVLVPFTVIIFIEIVRTIDEKKEEKENKKIEKKKEVEEEEVL